MSNLKITQTAQLSVNDLMKNISYYCDTGIKENIFSAISVGIYHQKSGFSILETKGITDPEQTDSSLLPESLFDLASLTKVFVAITTFKLLEKKIIRLDDTIEKLARKNRIISYDLSKVTIAQLLAHSSGMPASINVFPSGEWLLGKEYIVAKILKTQLENAPGKMFLYSDPGYIILGQLIEDILYTSLDKVIFEWILSPLKLTDICYNPEISWPAGIVRTAYSRPTRGPLMAGTVHDGIYF
jgi:CubicO group peptidase (beta-lactamase class C family)